MNSKTRWLGVLQICLYSVLLLLAAGSAAGQSEPPTLRNPLNSRGGADPWLTYYDGFYYLATTTWTSELTMRRAATLAGLKTAEPQRIYFETDPSRCCNMWAPEFHLLDGPNGPRWYFYYTAGTAANYDDQHTHVLESTGTDPLGPYTYKGSLVDPLVQRWAIDGSILELNDALYFLYSAWVGGFQSLFIAPMGDPWTLSGGGVVISQPELPWEQVGLNVNEAPVALYHEDDTFIVYSASFCGTLDYKLGLLTYTGGDPLSADAWQKHPEPVFQRSDENGVFAPGHNGFFQSPDGSENWIVYHANDTAEGGCDGRRTTRVQPFGWNDDGTPDFGTPVSTAFDISAPSGDSGTDPLPEMTPPVVSRFHLASAPDLYLRHLNFLLRLDTGVTPLADAQFVIVPGLADAEAVSIESANFPGFYLRHQNNAIRMSADDGTAEFAAAATWRVVPGLADPDAISFESTSQPGYYIGEMFGTVALAALDASSPIRAREAATFVEQR